MKFEPNELFFKMARMVQEKPEGSKLIIGNEGGSRSSKTWDAIHLIIWLCDHNRDKTLDIYFFRDTLVNCKEYLLKDFQNCLLEIGIWDQKCYTDNQGKPNYNLFGQLIKFRGLDDNAKEIKEATGSDIIFFNEILSGYDQDRVKNWIMRCEKLIIADWNPKYTDHWFFNYEKRDDTIFTHSTYKNNRHLPKSIVKEIESYNPDIPENVANGTADKYRWAVYGQGKRANREGLVFPIVKFVNKFPDDVEKVAYGLDFGTAHPTVIVKAGLKMNNPKPDLYLKKLFYSPCENSSSVIEAVKSIKIESHIWCDTNMDNTNTGIGWVSDMRRAGIRAFLTKKFPGSREYWITTLKKFNIHIVQDLDFKREQENFSYRVVDGIQLSETIDKYDDCWSASGYAVVGDFRI
ncbi:MAG TPA: phage terminase large subunit [Cyclobacteriaceae bacterium]|jgi:PBSX family phage terminase large subunit|nr:phage terminase large subunit [Cyclobacteriaceae bacterium]